jgi:copper(I)-binding protein
MALGVVFLGAPLMDARATERGHKDGGPSMAVTKGGITVSAPWARASAGRAANGAAYFTAVNKGLRPDRLIGVETPMARKASLHSHTMKDGIMRMRPVTGGLKIAPGGRLTFQSGGHHVMLMGLKSPLKAGGNFPLTLIFEAAGRITLNIAVRPIGTRAPRPMHHSR